MIRSFQKSTGTWTPAQTGFLRFPDGRFTAANATGVRYDAHRKRWLPAGLPTLDGNAYVYLDEATWTIHRVEVDTGLDEVILRGHWVPVGFQGGYLYLAEAQLIPDGGYGRVGLARVSPSGGTPAFMTHRPGGWLPSSLGAWALDRADGMMQAPDRVLHLDLETGLIEPWLTAIPGVMLSGFDGQGHPFVLNQGDSLRVVRLMGKNDATEVFLGPHGAPRPESPSYVDGERVWFSGSSIVDPNFEAPALLYQPGVGLRPSLGVPGAQVTVAGPCTKQ